MSVLIVIPARYASSRFPGKPLADLRGAGGVSRSLIERTWQVAKSVPGIDRVVIATDDSRIQAACGQFNAEVLMTSTNCANGTERCAEAHAALGSGFDIVVNLQGDAPLTPPWFVSDLVAALRNSPAHDTATPVLRCNGDLHASLLAERQAGRVGGTTAVFAVNRTALYFSKEVIPRTSQRFAADTKTPVWHHIGVYAYRKRALATYPALPKGPLEAHEGLEQLRFLENGRQMLCVEVNTRGRRFWELNNPEDIPILERMMAHMGVE